MIKQLPHLVARVPARVPTKLLVAFLSIVFMFVALGAVGLSVLRTSNERAESLVNSQFKIAAYRQLQHNTTAILYTVTSAMLTTNPRQLNAAKRQLNHFAYDFEHAQYVGTDEAESLAAIQADYAELIESSARVIDLISEGNLQAGRNYQTNFVVPLAERLERRTNSLVNKAEVAMVESAEISSHGYVISQVVVFGVALVAVLFALVLGYSISLSIVEPVIEINRRFSELSQGNFSGELQITNRDEMGDLADALNQMSRELGRLYREIQAASRHKSEFLANMSHELRTPLNAIIGFSEMLDEQVFGELNEKQAEYVRDIHESGNHLLSLINDILDLSKIEAGRMDLDLKKFDAGLALQNASTLVKERCLRHGIALGVEFDAALGEIVADERKFKQILLNLLSNAIKFTPEGGKIEVHAKVHDKNLEIVVTDTGIGISPEDQEHIFDEFRQVAADNGQTREGTGLGLTLTRKFIEMHGGAISVESEVGKGSAFRFSIPLSASAQVPLEALPREAASS